MADAEAPLPDFDPVPRRYRHDGWTPERQRGFIAALAETGSVTAAGQRIGMATEGAYALRRQPGADGFSRAWEAALALGVRRLTDIAIDRAIEGVAVPVYSYGKLIGERRVFNDRLLMFILRHHLPERYGKLAKLPAAAMRKRDAELRRQWEQERAEEEHERVEQARANLKRKLTEMHDRMTGGDEATWTDSDEDGFRRFSPDC